MISRLPAAAALLGATALASPCLAQTNWVPTATQALPVSALTGAADLGAVPGIQPLTLRIGLQPHDKAGLVALVRAQLQPSSVNYGKFLTPAQFAAAYGAPAGRVDAVVAYLRKAGFTGITVEPNHLLISANGTAAQASSAFHTALEQVSIGGGNVQFVNIAAAQVPAVLGDSVSAVLGLNSVGKMVPQLAFPLPQYLVSYTPKQFQSIYGASTVAPPRRASVAIMAEGDLTGVLSDLRIAEAAFGLPQVKVEVVQVGAASADVSGADEWDMDTQYSSGIAQNLQTLYVYDTTSLTDSDLALEFSRWSTDDKAKAASASLGECEIFPYVDGSMTVDDMIFLEAASQGQSFFASAGDTGSFCPVGPAGVNGVPLGAPLVNYPAASPYVVGVGGTTLLTTTAGAYDKEITWNTGGGGVSQFEPSPAWQQAAVPVLAKTDMRGVPDVAMDADPNSGAVVYVNGAAEVVGGTSLSSPLSLGIWARALSVNPQLGLAGPRLYGLYDGAGVLGSYPKGGFHDITLGNNGLYFATPGYDLTTGLGTFVIQKFVADLSK